MADIAKMKIGDTVTCNTMGLGLPYSAKVEKIGADGKIMVRPFHPTLTEGSARRSKTREGDSVRARWVKAAYVSVPPAQS